MNLKKNLFFVFCLLSTVSMLGQDKTPISIKIKANGMTNTHCFVAHHFGSTKYKVDSVHIDAKGNGFYKDVKNTVKGGIFMLVFPERGNQYLEFLVSGKEKNIEISFDSSNFQKVIFKNSEENNIFYEDIKYLEPFHRTMTQLSDDYKNEKDEAKKKKIEADIRTNEKALVDRRLSIINTKSHLLYAKILNMMREIDVPEAKPGLDGKIDSNFKYFYYKDHYWDYTDFNDDRLLYTPIFENKFKNYFDKIVIKHPDTLKKEMDRVLTKINKPSSDMMKYCLATLLNDYANSKIMGQDALYVYLVNNYYAKNKAPWTDSASLKKMIYDAQDLEPLLIGKVAPNFAAFDTSLVNYARLYDMNTAYKLLVFWSPDCGHCKTEIPRIDSIYPQLLKENCDIFAVSTIADDGKGENVKMWKDFIREKKLKFKNYADPKYMMNPLFKVLYHIKGTPEYYLLDSENKIIAKKLGPDQIVDFISNYKKTLKK